MLAHVLAAIGILASCVLFAGWVRVQCISHRYRLARMVELQEELEQDRAALEIERQMLRSPQRISRLAEQQYGMVLPDAGDRVVLK